MGSKLRRAQGVYLLLRWMEETKQEEKRV